jgi:hypothetical protein
VAVAEESDDDGRLPILDPAKSLDVMYFVPIGNAARMDVDPTKWPLPEENCNGDRLELRKNSGGGE